MSDLSREQVRAIDRRAFKEYGVIGLVLMENAGRGCAELLMRLNPERKPVTILCGPGNNGGDGYVIARHLDNAGWPVVAWRIAEEDELAGDAAINHRIAHSTGLLGNPGQFPDGWIVDALFGTGLTRAIAPPYDAWIAAINASGCPVLAVDLPSGLDCDTGEPLGPTVRATHTATFVAPKLGFRNPASREWTGEVHVIDISAPQKLLAEYGLSPRSASRRG